MLGYGGQGPFGFVRVRLIRFGQVWSGGLGAAGHVTSLCGPLRFGWARQGGQIKRSKIMAGFKKKDRQRIIDEYLAATGRNMFHPAEFVDWLKDKPEHEAYDLFYSMNDEDAARQWRVQMARQMASGLRIVVNHSDPDQKTVNITVREYPAFVSPAKDRRQGGGYHAFDPDDEILQQELRRQAAVGLASWLNRYRGCAENIGLDMQPIESIAEVLRGVEEEVA